jgi:S-DNA-T family DNA segregation ATPase FtsK/SpoIIIE
MNLQVTLYDRTRGRRASMVVQGDVDSPMSEVYALLSEAAGGQELYLGQELLTHEGRVGESGLREGSLLHIGAPEPPQRHRRGWEMVVVGGPDAGRVESLKKGAHWVGSVPGDGVFVDDRTMRNRHLQLFVTAEEVTVAPASVDARTFVDGDLIGDTVVLVPGEVIRAGASLIEIRHAPIPDGDVTEGYGVTVEFNRPPRIRPPRVEEATFYMPTKPRLDEDKEPFPWIQVIGPLLFAVGGMLIFKQVYFLFFGLLSPILAIGTLYERRRRTRKREHREKAKYIKKRRELDANAKHASIVELHALRYLHPDVVSISDLATQPRKRLWERRREDADFLEIRVGTAEIESGVTIEGMREEKVPPAPRLADAPVKFDLKQAGILGVAAGTEKRRAIGRWLLAQIAVLHSPRDLRLFLFTSEDAAAEWDWVRWLPHARNDGVGVPFANVAIDQFEHDEMVRMLLDVCNQRMEAAEAREFVLGKVPAIVVLLDGVRELRSKTSLPQLLRDGPKVGIYAIGLDSVSSRLAEEGRVELVVDNNTQAGARLQLSDEKPVTGMVVDLVDSVWAERVARSLSSLIDVSGSTSDNALPSGASFVDLFDVDLDTPKTVLENWKRHGRTTLAQIGADAHGTFSIDLKRDGPHALIAGTTGSGKSEFLQTLVASLAYVNRPEAMNFVLVDYKGGSAFADCARLPHTVGMVTDLDGHLTERALTALDAELKRREAMLKHLHAADIDAAWQQDPKAASQGLARLVIVIDEFAELVHELPDFVDGLVRIARVGRSLGVHLILATQRPAGVVSPEIRSNTGLRIALRMEDKADSQEVIDKADAAMISRATPGRGYARLGGGGSLIPFQSARIAGRRKGRTEGLASALLVSLPWKRLGLPLPRASQTEVEGNSTDLHFLVERILEAADVAHVTPQKSPWLPALAEHFVLPDVGGRAVGDAVFAIEDHPSEQSQVLRAFDLEHGSHLLLGGSARSGRSTALRTIGTVLAEKWSPNDLHLYGMDFGNGALMPIAELPHTGAVTMRHEHERIDRLINRFLAEITSRQQLLARGGFGDINEQRANSSDEERLPFIVLLFDLWDGFASEFPLESGTEYHDLMMQIVREGPSVGVRVVLTGDRALLLHRAASLFDERLVLHLSNKDDYGLAGLKAGSVPESMPPGRAMMVSTGAEMQFGLLSASSEVVAQVGVLRNVASRSRAEFPHPMHVPFRVDGLPSTISLSDALELPKSPAGKSPLTCVVGVGGDTLSAHCVDLQADGPYFIVGGQPKSGRSTAALAMASSALQHGATVIAITPKASPLRSLAAQENAYVFSGEDREVEAVGEVFNSSDNPVLVIVDNSELIQGTAVEDLIIRAAAGNIGEVGVVVVGLLEQLQNQFRGLPAEARKSHLGLLLSPQSAMDGDIAGVRLARTFLGRAAPGRGVYCANDVAVFVQVPEV